MAAPPNTAAMTALTAVAVLRPNALDRAVSAIPAHALMTRSPFDLVDPARMAAAVRLEQTQVLLWIAVVALQISVLVWFWSSGRSAALRDALRERLRSEFWVRFCFAALLALLDKAVALVPQAAQYRFLRIMGLTEQLFRTWLWEWIVGLIVAVIAAGFVAAFVLWLADRTHQWYIYTLGGIMGFTLLVLFAAPVFARPPYSTAPLTRTETAALAALRMQTGVQAPLLQQSVATRTRLGSNFVAGLGGTQVMVLTDTLLASHTSGEVRYAIAREMMWIKNNTQLQMALVLGAFLVVGAALAVTVSDRIGFRRDDDPLSRLSLLGAIIGLVYVIGVPFYNSYSRHVDIGADQAALAVTHDPESAIRLQVRRADQSLVTVCPNVIALWYLSPHPPPGPRIAALQGVPNVCGPK